MTRIAAMLALLALFVVAWSPSDSADATTNANANATAAAVAAPAAAPATVAYPQGYREWAHVKSSLVSPAHKNFQAQGGFQHIYANPQARIGYRTREFPEGSVVVFEWLEMTDKEGAFSEGPRRQVDVMVKDAQRFAATGGWGFQRFVKDTTELAASPTPQDCFACHDKLKKDGYVLSSYRR